MQKAKLKLPNFKEEQKLWQQGYDFVVGLDEVGRGPLAGPVIACAFCFYKKQNAQAKLKTQNSKLKNLENIKDSKKLSANQRAKWFEFLTTHLDVKWGIGIVSEKTIDRINILEATKLAMKRALENLKIEADYLLLDGNFLLDDLLINQKAMVRGDEKIWSCAAASIIAKVTRDRLMVKYHQKFPQYGFDSHKGYGTRQHFAAIQQHGPCAIHRLSFAPFNLNKQ
ncbi:MAG: Ribonuclease HII [Parcubacteria group bacterium GW2011_GWA2_43_9b]|nr:MAG: Ribonuclease HII [Parcubacteria group bacterium GW2011_GWA2_43_9b]